MIALAAPVAVPLACGAEEGKSRDDSPVESVTESAAPLSAPVPSAYAPMSCAPQRITPDPPDSCGDYMRLPCGLPAGVVQGSRCYLWLNDCKKICPEHYFNCHAVDDSCVDGNIVKDANGGVTIDCSTCAKGVGRIPAGLAPARRARATSPLGDYFATASHLEAASVHAFARLRAELAAHGAPAPLLRAARRAQRDEVRHARLTRRLARRHGGVPVRPRVVTVAPRRLDAIAIENAVEGCIRETFGALVASFQAANAQDPEVAATMESIARDETRHAALSWAVARWAWARLDSDARARLHRACDAAIASLSQDACVPVADDLRVVAGLPDARQHRALLGAVREQLWSRL
jgi:hypothetical protein